MSPTNGVAVAAPRSVDADLFEQVRLVVDRTDHTLIGCRQRDRAVERIVGRAGAEGLGLPARALPRWRSPPHPTAVPAATSPPAAGSCRRAGGAQQQVALEIILLGGADASAIVVLVGAAAQVPRQGIGVGFAVHDALSQQLRAAALAHKEMRRPLERVIQGTEMVIAAVPDVDRLAGDIVQCHARAGLHARLADRCAKHVERMDHDRPTERIAVDRAGCPRCPVRRAWHTGRLRRCRRLSGRVRPSVSKCTTAGVPACAAAFCAAACSAAPSWPFARAAYQVGR